MKIYTEMTPYEFLCNESWECDKLQDLVTSELTNDFNGIIEMWAPDAECMSKTELNDLMRFNEEEILCELGLDDEVIEEDE